MSSREIAELTGKQHSHVYRDTESMLRQLDIDFDGYIHLWTHPQNKQRYAEFILNKDLTITLVSGYNVKMRHVIIKRWQELENKTVHQIPQTLSQALMLASNQAEQIEKQEEALKLAAPKVEFVDRFVESTGNKTFREVAKLLKANEREFRAFLVESQVMYKLNRTWTARAQHLNAGRFSESSGEKNGRAFFECKLTPKGVEYIAGKWVAHKEIK